MLLFPDSCFLGSHYSELITKLEKSRNVEVADWMMVTPNTPARESFVHRWVGWIQNQPRVCVMAHGWGAWVATWILSQVGTTNTDLFLICPDLGAGRRDPQWLRVLHRFPGLNLSLIRLGMPEKRARYLPSIFYPAQPTPQLERLWLQDSQDPRFWLRAWLWRDFASLTPTFENRHLANRVSALVGAQDRVSRLSLSLSFETQEFSRAGHALPWTHAQDIADWVDSRLLPHSATSRS
jgi:hypothetical protein